MAVHASNNFGGQWIIVPANGPLHCFFASEQRVPAPGAIR
jgi:hypothetical protein